MMSPSKSPFSTDPLKSYYLRKGLFYTLVYSLVIFSVNSFIFLAMTSQPLSNTRPWTLFLSEYANRGHDVTYLLWQILLSVSLGQVAIAFYKNFKEPILNNYYQLKEQINALKARSRSAEVSLDAVALSWRIIRSPYTYHREVYQGAQVLLLTVVAWIIWANLYLYLFHLIPVISLNMKNVMVSLTAASHVGISQVHFFMATTLSLISVIVLAFSLWIICRALTLVKQKEIIYEQ